MKIGKYRSIKKMIFSIQSKYHSLNGRLRGILGDFGRDSALFFESQHVFEESQFSIEFKSSSALIGDLKKQAGSKSKSSTN